MNQLVSYAQNFEDVILHRALSSVEEGNYVDIGAQSALVDSVSRMFHDLGWHGVHVEPVSFYADELESGRPGDQVLRVAVGDHRGTIAFHELPSTGLSTVDAGIASRHRIDGFDVVAREMPLVTLDDIFDRAGFKEVHWLKIDVEGFEESVIRGWKGMVRPWIVVVESTLPLSQVQTHQAWEHMLIAMGYTFAYFDGLNRFYVASDHRELLGSFGPGPNVFDDFSLSGVASQPFTRLLKADVESAKSEAKARAADLERVVAEFAVFRRGAAATSMELTLTQTKLTQLKLDAAETSDAFDRLNERVVDITTDLQQQRDSAYYWWVTAEQLRVELDAVKNSRSWRFTAPIRGLRGGQFSIGQFVKHIARAVLARVMVRVVRRPVLARPLKALLSLAPGVKARLRRVGVAYGIVEDDMKAVTVLDLHVTAHHPALSRKASRVLDDLNVALAGDRG